jgi:hypothetical protein
MPSDRELPEVLPSAPDDEYECVLADPEAARAPTTGAPTAGLCPPGYVPRRKRRGSYGLRGKEAVVDGPPEQNPQRNPDRRPGDATR